MPKKPAYAARCPSALDPAAAPLPIQARDLLLEARSLNSREEPAFENTPIRRKTKVELSSDFEGGNFEGEKLKEVIVAIWRTCEEEAASDAYQLRDVKEKRLRLARNLKELVRNDLVICCYFFTTSENEVGEQTAWDLLLKGIQHSRVTEITKELIQVLVLVVSNVGLGRANLESILRSMFVAGEWQPNAGKLVQGMCAMVQGSLGEGQSPGLLSPNAFKDSKMHSRAAAEAHPRFFFFDGAHGGLYLGSAEKLWGKQGYAITTSLWVNNASTDVAFFLFSITETDQVDETNEKMVMDVCICEHGFIFNVFIDSHKVFHEFRVQIPQKRWFKLAVNHKSSSFLSKSEVEIWIDNRRYSHSIPMPKQEGLFRLYAGCPTTDTLNIPTTVRWSKSVLPLSFFKGLMGTFKFFPTCLSEAEVQSQLGDAQTTGSDELLDACASFSAYPSHLNKHIPLVDGRSFPSSQLCLSSGNPTALMIGTLKLGGQPNFAESLECLGGPAMFLPWLAACFTVPTQREDQGDEVSGRKSLCDSEEIFLSFLLLMRSFICHDVFLRGNGMLAPDGYSGKNLVFDQTENEGEIPWIAKLMTTVESIFFRIPSSHLTPEIFSAVSLVVRMSAYDSFEWPETNLERKYFDSDKGRAELKELENVLAWLLHVELWAGRNVEIVELVIKEIRNAAALNNSLFFKILGYHALFDFMMDLLWTPESNSHTISIINGFRQDAPNGEEASLRETMFEALDKLLGQEDESSDYVEAARADQEFWTFLSSTLAQRADPSYRCFCLTHSLHLCNRIFELDISGNGNGLLVNSPDWRCILLELVMHPRTIWFSLANIVIYYALLKPSEKHKFFSQGGSSLLIHNVRSCMKALQVEEHHEAQHASAWQHTLVYGFILDLSVDDCLFTRRLLSEGVFNAGILDSSILEGLDCIQSPMSLYIDSEHCILRTEMIQVMLEILEVCNSTLRQQAVSELVLVVNRSHQTRSNFLSVPDWEQKIVNLVRPPRLHKATRWTGLPSVVTWHQNPTLVLRGSWAATPAEVERMSLDQELSPIEELDALMWLTTKMISRLISDRIFQAEGWRSFVNVLAAWKTSELVEHVFASGKIAASESARNTSERDLMTLLFKHACLVLQDVISQVEKWDSNMTIPEREAPVSTLTLRENFGGILASLTYSELSFRSAYGMMSSVQTPTRLVWEHLQDSTDCFAHASLLKLLSESLNAFCIRLGLDGTKLPATTFGRELVLDSKGKMSVFPWTHSAWSMLMASLSDQLGVDEFRSVCQRLVFQGIGRIEVDPLALPRAALTVQRFEKLERALLFETEYEAGDRGELRGILMESKRLVMDMVEQSDRSVTWSNVLKLFTGRTSKLDFYMMSDPTNDVARKILLDFEDELLRYSEGLEFGGQSRLRARGARETEDMAALRTEASKRTETLALAESTRRLKIENQLRFRLNSQRTKWKTILKENCSDFTLWLSFSDRRGLFGEDVSVFGRYQKHDTVECGGLGLRRRVKQSSWGLLYLNLDESQLSYSAPATKDAVVERQEHALDYMFQHGLAMKSAPRSKSLTAMDESSLDLVLDVKLRDQVDKFECCLVSARGVVKGILLLQGNRLKFIPSDVQDRCYGYNEPVYIKETMSKIKVWNLNNLSEVHGRRFLLQPDSLELYFHGRRSILLSFPPPAGEKAESVVSQVYKRLVSTCGSSLKIHFLFHPGKHVARAKLTDDWVNRKISNFEYLMHLNYFSGRSYNDLTQYPVMPWILADYSSASVDLTNPKSFRDLSRPIGVQTQGREEYFKERYAGWHDDEIPPFHYGSHYSNPGFVLWFLVRLEPYASSSLHLQGGHFDYPDRLFWSVADAWLGCTTSSNDVKELIPEFFYLPDFLLNRNKFELGSTQNGSRIDDVVLPPWANESAAEFISINRQALESEYVSSHLHHWIDLIFGYKQQGQPAVDATNVFYYLTYEDKVDMSSIADPHKLNATTSQIANFGQTPRQLFSSPHPKRAPLFRGSRPVFTPTSETTMKTERGSAHSTPVDANGSLSLQSEFLSDSSGSIESRAFSRSQSMPIKATNLFDDRPAAEVDLPSKSEETSATERERTVASEHLPAGSVKDSVSRRRASTDATPTLSLDSNVIITPSLAAPDAVGLGLTSSYLGQNAARALKFSVEEPLGGIRVYSLPHRQASSKEGGYVNIFATASRVYAVLQSGQFRCWNVDWKMAKEGQPFTAAELEVSFQESARKSGHAAPRQGLGELATGVSKSMIGMASGLAGLLLTIPGSDPAATRLRVAEQETPAPGLHQRHVMIERSSLRLFVFPGMLDGQVRWRMLEGGTATLQGSRRIHRDVVTCMATAGEWSHALGHWLITGSRDTTVRVWHLGKGELRGAALREWSMQPFPSRPRFLLHGHTGSLVHLSACLDLDVIVSSSDQGMVALHSFSKGRFLRRFAHPSLNPLDLVELSPLGDIFMYSSQDETLHATDVNLTSTRSVRVAGVCSFVLSFDANVLFVGLSNGMVVALLSRTLQRMQTLPRLLGDLGSVTALRLSLCGNYLLAATSRGLVQVFTSEFLVRNHVQMIMEQLGLKNLLQVNLESPAINDTSPSYPEDVRERK